MKNSLKIYTLWRLVYLRSQDIIDDDPTRYALSRAHLLQLQYILVHCSSLFFSVKAFPSVIEFRDELFLWCVSYEDWYTSSLSPQGITDNVTITTKIYRTTVIIKIKHDKTRQFDITCISVIVGCKSKRFINLK